MIITRFKHDSITGRFYVTILAETKHRHDTHEDAMVSLRSTMPTRDWFVTRLRPLFFGIGYQIKLVGIPKLTGVIKPKP